jgi:anti-anti-sigma regulatory factor
MVIEMSTLGVKHARKFFDSLKEELENNDNVIVDFSNVENIDLSIVQILTVLTRSGKMLKIKSVSHEVRIQLLLCGLKF